jgi:uncharacterized protein YbjT (DUF2867 family)
MGAAGQAGPAVVVGASGSIGARLADRLFAAGVPLRVAGRRLETLRTRWPDVEAVELDVLRPESIAPALAGADTAYYLVHAMGAGEAGFEDRDRIGAQAFADSAAAAGLRRIVYLGGLGAPDDDLSHHLASRQETGRLLARGECQVLEFRAGMVIAEDSASFRMLNDLVKRLPVMVTPEWVRTKSQPIAVLTVPVLTPRLSSLWCGLVTSVPVSIARPLIDGLVNETIVRDTVAARQLFPDVHPIGFDDAVRAALGMVL